MKKKYINDLDKITSIANSDLIIIQTDEGTRVATYESIKNQLNIPEHITIDSALSIDSTNPVQNKAVYASVNSIIDSLNTLIENFNALQIPDAVFVDDTLSETSENAIMNKTVYTKFDDVNTAINALNDTITSLNIPDAIEIDLAINAESQNPVANSAIAAELESLSNNINALSTEIDNFVIPDPVTVDTELNGSSMNPIANAVVQSAISGIQTTVSNLQDIVDALDIPDHITIDSELKNDSTNPVQNRVVDNKFKEVEQSITTLQTNIDNIVIPEGVTTDAALDGDSTNPVQNKVINTAITNINTNIENINNTLLKFGNGNQSVGVSNGSYSLIGNAFKEDAKPIFTDESNYNNRLVFSYGNDSTANSPTGKFMQFIDLGWSSKELHGILGFDIVSNELYSANLMEGTWSNWTKYITNKNIGEYTSNFDNNGFKLFPDSNNKEFYYKICTNSDVAGELAFKCSNDVNKCLVFNIVNHDVYAEWGPEYEDSGTTTAALYPKGFGCLGTPIYPFNHGIINYLMAPNLMTSKIIFGKNRNLQIIDQTPDSTIHDSKTCIKFCGVDEYDFDNVEHLILSSSLDLDNLKINTCIYPDRSQSPVFYTKQFDLGNSTSYFDHGYIDYMCSRWINFKDTEWYIDTLTNSNICDGTILQFRYGAKGTSGFSLLGYSSSFTEGSTTTIKNSYLVPSIPDDYINTKTGTKIYYGFYLGNSNENNRFSGIYLKTAANVSSDKRQKKEISYIGNSSEYNDTFLTDDQLVNFVDNLSSVVYKRKEDDTKIHHGLIAQDVEEVLNKLGIDHAVLSKTLTEDGKDYTYGLCYEELIGDIIRYAQILKNEKEDLKSEVEDLRKELNEIKELLNNK